MSFALPSLPLVCPQLAECGLRLASEVDAFTVEEVPAYLPVREGPHLWVWLEKEGWATPPAVRALARAAGVPERDLGIAGLKDKVALTRQWVSLPDNARDPASWHLPEGLRVLEVSRHRNKLKRGQLHGNRFRLRFVADQGLQVDHLQTLPALVQQRGLINAFGPQRFGVERNNVEQALAWLQRGPSSGPKERFYRSFFPSVLQSFVFQHYAALRVAAGWDRPLRGEVVRLAGTGSFFRVEDVEAEQPRWDKLDLLPTGPLPGAKGVHADDEAAELEHEAWRASGLDRTGILAAIAPLAPGARRDVRLFPEDLRCEGEVGGNSLTLSFTLPAGAYATVVAREWTHRFDPREEGAG